MTVTRLSIVLMVLVLTCGVLLMTFFFMRTVVNPSNIVVREVSVEDGAVRITVDFAASGLFFAGYRVRTESGALYLTVRGTPLRILGKPLPTEIVLPYEEIPNALYLEGGESPVSVWVKPS